MAYAAGLTQHFVDFVASSCLGKKLSWLIGGTMSTPTCTRRGTPQGCAMSILLFQILLAPAVREIRCFLASQCSTSRIIVYADDIVLICTSGDLLRRSMNYMAELLTSLDLVVNPSKSAVAVLVNAAPVEIQVQGVPIPTVENPDILGSTLTTEAVKLVITSSLANNINLKVNWQMDQGQNQAQQTGQVAGRG
eukprot:2856918-Amphidinium_carterae.1